MFDNELYEISEEATKKIKERNQKIEKEVLDIIKAYAYTTDENGLVKIIISSKKNPYEYDVFSSMISSGQLKYFEEEYSLYFLSDEHMENVISFTWNGLEYNIRNMSKAKRR